jgi:hypothetical protein
MIGDEHYISRLNTNFSCGWHVRERQDPLTLHLGGRESKLGGRESDKGGRGTSTSGYYGMEPFTARLRVYLEALLTCMVAQRL